MEVCDEGRGWYRKKEKGREEEATMKCSIYF